MSIASAQLDAYERNHQQTQCTLQIFCSLGKGEPFGESCLHQEAATL